MSLTDHGRIHDWLLYECVMATGLEDDYMFWNRPFIQFCIDLPKQVLVEHSDDLALFRLAAKAMFNESTPEQAYEQASILGINEYLYLSIEDVQELLSGETSL